MLEMSSVLCDWHKGGFFVEELLYITVSRRVGIATFRCSHEEDTKTWLIVVLESSQMWKYREGNECVCSQQWTELDRSGDRMMCRQALVN